MTMATVAPSTTPASLFNIAPRLHTLTGPNGRSPRAMSSRRIRDGGRHHDIIARPQHRIVKREHLRPDRRGCGARTIRQHTANVHVDHPVPLVKLQRGERRQGHYTRIAPSAHAAGACGVAAALTASTDNVQTTHGEGRRGTLVRLRSATMLIQVAPDLRTVMRTAACPAVCRPSVREPALRGWRSSAPRRGRCRPRRRPRGRCGP